MDKLEETKEKPPVEEPDSTYMINGDHTLSNGRPESQGSIQQDISGRDSDDQELIPSAKSGLSSKKNTSKVANMPGSDTNVSNKNEPTNSFGNSKRVSPTTIVPKSRINEDITPIQNKVKGPVQEVPSENLDLYKRSGTYIEYANEIEPELERAKILSFGNEPVVDETDEEDNVYPLSIKYDKKKACKTMILRYFFLFVFIILLIPTDVYTFGEQRKLDYRTGIFANRIWEESFTISGITNFNINTKNCVIYFLENKGANDKIDLYVSASFSASVSTSVSGTTQNIGVSSSSGWVSCYVELKVPGGVTIPQLSLTFNGDTIPDLVVYDSKDGSTWTTPMTITTLSITVQDSYPNVVFENAHTVTTLTVSGTY